MKPFPRDLMEFAGEHHGLVTLAQAKAWLSPRQRQLALASGQLVVVHQGVYRLGSHPATFEQRCLAPCLALPDVVLSGPTLGRILRLRRVTTTSIHVVSHRHIRLRGVVGHRTNLLEPEHIVERGVLRMLEPARLACDLSHFLDDDDLESVIEQLLDRRMTTATALRETARRFMRSGRDGTLRIGRVLDARPDWRRPVGSDLELRLLRALMARGLELEPQVAVAIDADHRVIIDLAHRGLRFGIEVDHVTWHGGRLDVQRDKTRDRVLLAQGWVIARVTDDDIRLRLEATADDLVTISRRLRRAA